MKRPSGYKTVLAVHLLLMLIWVPVACLSICLDCCEEEIHTAATAELPEEVPAIQSSDDDCLCPVPQAPQGVLQKSEAYDAFTNNHDQALAVGGAAIAIARHSQVTEFIISPSSFKPPPKGPSVLRI